MKMKFIKTVLPGVIIIEPKIWQDERGSFYESYREIEFLDNGICDIFIQDNYSMSHREVLRGLHYQIGQSRIVQCISGKVFDVSLDLRSNSPTFGKWFGTILSSENRHQIFIPRGLAHGFYVLSEEANISYKFSQYYDPSLEITILWNDPTINIDWPLISNNPIVSEKDKKGIRWE
jgi:dTDP-4-dehydrorhamnose 3,5-epimerase